MRHLGQREEGAGGDSRQAHANGSASSHRYLISSDWVRQRARVLGKSLSTFVTLGNKHTIKLNFHTCNNRKIRNTNTMITVQTPALS